MCLFVLIQTSQNDGGGTGEGGIRNAGWLLCLEWLKTTVRRINTVYAVSISLIKKRMDESYKLNIFIPQIIEG